MTAPAIPGRAVMVVRQHLINRGCTIPVDEVRQALEAAEAAWPHGPPERPAEPALAAAWREGYGQGRDDEAAGLPVRETGSVLQGFERDLTEAETEALRERFREAQRSGKITILADDTGQRIAEAVAAERERIAQLADQHEYPSFADLLREQP